MRGACICFKILTESSYCTCLTILIKSYCFSACVTVRTSAFQSSNAKDLIHQTEQQSTFTRVCFRHTHLLSSRSLILTRLFNSPCPRSLLSSLTSSRALPQTRTRPSSYSAIRRYAFLHATRLHPGGRVRLFPQDL